MAAAAAVDPAANALAERHYPGAVFLARKYGRRALGAGIEDSDRLSYAGEAVIRASRKYDPARGVTLPALAEICFRWLLIDRQRQLHSPTRRPGGGLKSIDGARWLPADRRAADPAAAVDAADQVAALLARLPAGEADALRAVYLAGQTGRQAAGAHGAPAAAVMRRARRGIERIRLRLGLTGPAPRQPYIRGTPGRRPARTAATTQPGSTAMGEVAAAVAVLQLLQQVLAAAQAQGREQFTPEERAALGQALAPLQAADAAALAAWHAQAPQ